MYKVRIRYRNRSTLEYSGVNSINRKCLEHAVSTASSLVNGDVTISLKDGREVTIFDLRNVIAIEFTPES